MKHNINSSKISAASGFSLVEVIVAIVVFTMIAIIAVQLLRSGTKSVENQTDTKEFETRLDEALSSLTANAKTLNSGGSFSVNESGDEISDLTACSAATCDYVQIPDNSSIDSRTSPANGIPYGKPTLGTRNVLRYLRRWRVDDAKGGYDLKIITVAIFKNETDAQPVMVQQATVGTN